MPYIKEKEKEFLDGHGPDTPGQLNFVITKVLLFYLQKHGIQYRTINDCVGVLECAKQELYRRIATPYENEACERNGDVYPDLSTQTIAVPSNTLLTPGP